MTQPIPFVDLRSQYAAIQDEVAGVIQGVLDSCTFIGGESLAAFEQEFATFCQTEFAVGVASGTDALHLTLRALGVGAGDEVITVANTFIATGAAIEMVGARPVFVDIDPNFFTIDPALIESAITARTRAIIPVHLFGQPADMDPILEIARRYNLSVIEDAAQAHGAEYKGRRAGSIGHAGCFSFYPGKNLGAYGDGGAITTSDPKLVRRLHRLRDHGRSTKYEHAIVGYNSRLDALQAGILRVKLRHLDAWNRQRRQVAAWYRAHLRGSGLTIPAERPDSTHVYHLYVVATADRDRRQRRLAAMQIGTGIHYPVPLHLQPAFRHLGYREGDLPHAEAAAKRILSLPMFPELTWQQTAHIAESVRAPHYAEIPAD